MIEAFIEANKPLILKSIIDEIKTNDTFRIQMRMALKIPPEVTTK